MKLTRLKSSVKKQLFSPQSLLEVIQTHPIPISLWILIGSILGGLLLLALLVFCLWKVSPTLVEAGNTVSTIQNFLSFSGKGSAEYQTQDLTHAVKGSAMELHPQSKGSLIIARGAYLMPGG